MNYQLVQVQDTFEKQGCFHVDMARARAALADRLDIVRQSDYWEIKTCLGLAKAKPLLFKEIWPYMCTIIVGSKSLSFSSMQASQVTA